MDYVSTRNKERKVSAAYAIANGIAPDGGLYCPTAFPTLTDADWKTLAESDYKGRSALILGKFLTDFTAEELADTLGFSDKNSVRPRLTELKALRLVGVIDKRKARSGKKTAVWAALEEGKKA